MTTAVPQATADGAAAAAKVLPEEEDGEEEDGGKDGPSSQLEDMKPPPNPSFLTRVFMTHVSTIIKTAHRNRKLEITDICATRTTAASDFAQFSAIWAEEQQKPKPKLRKAMFRLVARTVYTGIALQGLSNAMELLGPVLLNQVLRTVELRQSGACSDETAILSGEEYLCDDGFGYALCAAIFVSTALGALGKNHAQLLFMQTALTIRGAMITAVYDKTMRLSCVGMSKTGAGMINNLSANDTEQLLVSMPVLANIVFAPVFVVIAMVMLAQTVGPSFLGGFGAMLLVLCVSSKAIAKMMKCKVVQLKFSDARVKLTNELLAGVRIVKAYGWEVAFRGEVMKIRNQETHQIRLQNFLMASLIVIILMSPVILAIVTFSVYTTMGNTLRASTVFTAVALLNIVRFPMAFLPFGLAQLLNLSISFSRLQTLLEADASSGSSPDPSMGTADATGTGAGETRPVCLTDVEFGYPLESPEARAKGKGKGKGKGCLGACMGKLCAGKGKKEGKRDSDDKASELEIDAASIVEVKRGSDVVKFRRVLRVDKFEAAPSGLTVVVGPVGSGKTSLLAALLGEVEQVSAGNTSSRFSGSVAYASQTPWIINTTLEDNVRYTDPDIKKEAWYQQVLEACCLSDDLDLLPAGDQTEIGERGINLSGGQRARVSVARAVYRQDADMYLFDDPLAAIDAHVGKCLFDNVFGPKGILMKKMRILVTHQVQYLPFADRVVVVDNGSIVATGTYDELKASQSLKGLGLEEAKAESADNEEEAKDSGNVMERRTSKRSAEGRRMSGSGGLTSTEVAALGTVGASTFKNFLFEGIGLTVCIWAVASMIVKIAVQLCTDFWLAFWTTEGDPFGLSLNECIGVYAALGVAQALMTYQRAISVSAIGMVRASRRLYFQLFTCVFGSPVVFFDRTPTGRLLNRFTADMEVLDNQVSKLLSQLLGCTEVTGAIVVGIVILNPVVMVVIFPVCAAYYVIVAQYRFASRDSQRLVAITTTPIFNRISETLAGLPVVRAFGYEAYLKKRSSAELDRNQACQWLKVQCAAWLALRLEFLSSVITTSCALLPLLPFDLLQSDAAFVGVALTYSLDLSRYVQAIAKSVSECEQKFTSIERIFEYCSLPQEAANVLPADSALPKDWPPQGAVEYHDVTMRYRPELNPALCGLTFSVAAGEKLGVVGRTGSGKSSIIVTLLRLTEVESGKVLIDGQDVRLMGLHTLRQRLSMIPQEPVLFGKTTLRQNLDPFGEYSDGVVTEALAKVQMDTKEALPDGLGTEVQEGGAPFSVGQRQLLCLARAVLRRSRIILLDEATASVDNETDALIQRTIRETFQSSTVLCIAHRIRTIMDSNKILVMGAGVCQEFGSPEGLLATPGSQFRALAEESNIPVPPLPGHGP